MTTEIIVFVSISSLCWCILGIWDILVGYKNDFNDMESDLYKLSRNIREIEAENLELQKSLDLEIQKTLKNLEILELQKALDLEIQKGLNNCKLKNK